MGCLALGRVGSRKSLQIRRSPPTPSTRVLVVHVEGFLPTHWSTYNNYAPFFFSFAPEHEVPVDRWQSVQVCCIKTPVLSEAIQPRIQPKWLMTSITWSSIGHDLMKDDGTDF